MVSMKKSGRNNVEKQRFFKITYTYIEILVSADEMIVPKNNFSNLNTRHNYLLMNPN
jgi:hypothetical protein